MKKFFPITMRRCFLALFFTATLGLTGAWAQPLIDVQWVFGPVLPADIDISAASVNDACMSYSNQSTNTGNNKVLTINSITGVGGTITYTWSIKGGATIVGSTSGSSVTVNPYIEDNRFNKARVYLDYTGTKSVTVPNPCGGSPATIQVDVPTEGQLYFDLYQHFTYSDPIVGEECIDPAINYAFSIRDMVSGDKDHIGTDSYVWDLSDITDLLPAENPPFTYQRLYTSGDGSAIALDFQSEVTDTREISVIPGKCNTIPVAHTLRKKMVPATYSITGYADCIPTSVHQIAIVNDADANINYTWEFSNSNYTFATGSTSTSAAGITVNIGTEAGFIYLKSTPANSTYCAGTESGSITQIIEIKRSLDAGVSIFGESCVLPGGPYEYKLDPNVNTKLTWDLPDGWTIDGDNINASTINVTVAAGADEGTITVETVGCTGEGSRTKEVKIKPGTLGSISTANLCLTYGNQGEVVLSVVEIPNTVKYVWNIGAWSFKAGTDHDAASITVIPNGTSGAHITVYAEGSCANSNTSSTDIKVTPATPGTITRNTSGCINKGLEDLVTFSVTNDANADSYVWNLGGVGTGTSSTNSIDVTTIGTGGPYQVKVKAHNTCGDSPEKSLIVTFAGNGTVGITKSDLLIGGDKIGENLNADFVANTSYEWFKDGGSTPIATGRSLDIYDLDDPVVNHSYCVVATNSNTCITKTCTTSDYNSSRIAFSELKNNVVVFPNPAEHLVTIDIKTKFKTGSITLFDKEGSVISKSVITSSNNVLDVSNLTSGTYFVSVSIDGESTMQKIQVLH